jgi:hypothetical protein
MSPAETEARELFSSLPWWLYKAEVSADIPVFSELGLTAEPIGSEVSEWCCAREALWAMQQGLS